MANTGTLTLDAGGDPSAVFVFKVGGAFAMAAGAKIELVNGARASRVFWQVNGAGGVGADAKFVGTLMAHDAISVGANSEFNGRALALTGAIALNNNQFYSAPPVVTIAGGSPAFTNSTTPTISGTTDVVAPDVVTVSFAGQTLSATPSGGAWSVSSAILANGTYPVVASVSDGAGNTGSATQQLTVDIVLPVVTIDGGASITTNDSTPTIAGTSDVTPGTVVRVSVDAQNLTALVQSGGTRNVTTTALNDGPHTVTASVTDPAGNNGTRTQALTINRAAPAVTITGGANALTNQAAPRISGTANVAPGTTVTVTLADQTLSRLVQAGGAWSVTAGALSDGPHRVVLSVSDSTGNLASATQTLTVDTVPPFVAIAGGAKASTRDAHQTIAATTDAAPGTTVWVTIAGQTMTTLVQANGTWNATPAPVARGIWRVVAYVADPAGNVGRASQLLTIAGPTGGTGSPGGTGAPGGTGGSPGTAAPSGTGGTCPSGAGSTRAGSRLIVAVAAGRFTVAHGKRVPVSFILSAPANVSLTVLRGTRVGATLSIACHRAGSGWLIWSGKINRHSAPRGAYTIGSAGSGPASRLTARPG